MTPLRQRWISATVAIPLFLGVAFWGAVPFGISVMGLAALALVELVRAYRLAGILVNPPVAILGLALPAAAWVLQHQARAGNLPGGRGAGALPAWLFFVAICWLVAALLWEVLLAARRSDKQQIHTGRNLAYGLLCGVYVSLFGGMAWLRALPEWERADTGAGPFSAAPLFVTLFSVWATDSFAFFVGRALGKRKLALRLSPGKTVEGAIGGLIFGVLVGGLFGWLFLRDTGLGLVVGAVAGVLGQAGDLFESALKRELGIKDFGGILPGHGGVLDRFDSLLFVAPVASVIISQWR